MSTHAITRITPAIPQRILLGVLRVTPVGFLASFQQAYQFDTHTQLYRAIRPIVGHRRRTLAALKQFSIGMASVTRTAMIDALRRAIHDGTSMTDIVDELVDTVFTANTFDKETRLAFNLTGTVDPVKIRKIQSIIRSAYALD